MWKIKDLLIDSPTVVAPMAGVSNAAFRELAFNNGAGLVYTEMISDQALFYRNAKTLKMADIDDSFHPLALQLFGSDLSKMVAAAKYVDRFTNCDIIDINMGCPVKKVIKTGAGSALLLKPELAFKIVEEIVKAVKKPVSVKMRVGFTNEPFDYVGFARKLEACGISMLAVHGRTRSQMYEGKADWSKIKDIKAALKIPVVGNGDIKTVEDFKEKMAFSKVDAIMIGRGLIGNPFLLKEINNYLKGQKHYLVTYRERFDVCLKHFDKLIDLYGEDTAARQMRGLAPHYLNGLYCSARYRGLLNGIQNREDLKLLLNEYALFLDNYYCQEKGLGL